MSCPGSPRGFAPGRRQGSLAFEPHTWPELRVLWIHFYHFREVAVATLSGPLTPLSFGIGVLCGVIPQRSRVRAGVLELAGGQGQDGPSG